MTLASLQMPWTTTFEQLQPGYAHQCVIRNAKGKPIGQLYQGEVVAAEFLCNITKHATGIETKRCWDDNSWEARTKGNPCRVARGSTEQEAAAALLGESAKELHPNREQEVRECCLGVIAWLEDKQHANTLSLAGEFALKSLRELIGGSTVKDFLTVQTTHQP